MSAPLILLVVFCGLMLAGLGYAGYVFADAQRLAKENVERAMHRWGCQACLIPWTTFTREEYDAHQRDIHLIKLHGKHGL